MVQVPEFGYHHLSAFREVVKDVQPFSPISLPPAPSGRKQISKRYQTADVRVEAIPGLVKCRTARHLALPKLTLLNCYEIFAPLPPLQDFHGVSEHIALVPTQRRPTNHVSNSIHYPASTESHVPPSAIL